jgi:hypothetical protein
MNPATRALTAFTLTLWLGLAIGAIAQIPAIIQTHLQVHRP